MPKSKDRKKDCVVLGGILCVSYDYSVETITFLMIGEEVAGTAVPPITHYKALACNSWFT
jgi:hypothetical protein